MKTYDDAWEVNKVVPIFHGAVDGFATVPYLSSLSACVATTEPTQIPPPSVATTMGTTTTASDYVGDRVTPTTTATIPTTTPDIVVTAFTFTHMECGHDYHNNGG